MMTGDVMISFLCLYLYIYASIINAVSVLSEKDVQKALSGLGILVRGLSLLIMFHLRDCCFRDKELKLCQRDKSKQIQKKGFFSPHVVWGGKSIYAIKDGPSSGQNTTRTFRSVWFKVLVQGLRVRWRLCQ